jgi:hypothetical protein
VFAARRAGSVREINYLLLLRPVVTWLAFWLVALPFFVMAAATGHPWLDLGTLICMMGVTGLASAALLSWHRQTLTNLSIMAVNYLLLFGHPWQFIHTSFFRTTVGQLALLALGVAGMRANYLWQRRLLMRSHARYGATL